MKSYQAFLKAITRRHFFKESSLSIGSIALSTLLDDGLFARPELDADIAVDVGRCGILDGDAGRHQLLVLPGSHDSTHLFEFHAAVDAPNLVRIRDGQRFDALATARQDRRETPFEDRRS